MELRNLPEVLGGFAMCWLIFGIPTLLAVLVSGILIKRFQIHRLGILKRVRFSAVVWSVPLAGLIFGASTGYLAAWAERYDFQHGLDQSGSWLDVVAFPGAPGDAMANSYGGDWQDDEAWDYRGGITILNAMFWTSVAGVGVLVIWFVFRRGSVRKTGVRREVGLVDRPHPGLLPLEKVRRGADQPRRIYCHELTGSGRAM